MVQTQSPPVEEAGSPKANEPISITPNAPRAAQKASRKRTKTGCLTCRKRRIKCGEERPVCVNCTKSKRICEGYNQRVVFKHPSGAPHLAGHASGSAGPVPLAPSLTPGWNPSQSYPYTDSPQSWAHPATPRQTYDQSYANSALGLQAFGAFRQDSNYPGQPRQPDSSVHGVDSSAALGWNPQAVPVHPFDYSASTTLPTSLPALHDQINPRLNQNINPYAQAVASKPYQSFQTNNPPTTGHSQNLRREAHVSTQPEFGHSVFSNTTQAQTFVPASVSRQQSLASDDWQKVSPPSASAPNGRRFTFADPFGLERDLAIKPIKQEFVNPDNERRRYSAHDSVQQNTFGTAIPAAGQPPPPPIKDLKHDSENEEEDENDPWDVEMELSQTSEIPSADTQRELSMMVSRHATHDVARLRTFSTFLDNPNVLATYRPSPSSSPLTDEDTARIFCHFVHVTGPCISIFERQASNSSMSFHNAPVPQFPKTLWTYTLPSIALTHPPLMHAILALSSLHIAKLQSTSDAPSMKHFTYALRRVSKLIGLPKRRNEIPTLAANLLVGFYEIVLADHSKWNIHLSGAKILVMEINFASMTRRLRRMRAEARERIARTPAFSYEDYIRIAGVPETLLPDKDWEVEEALISQLTGLHVNYDDQWQARTNTPVPMHDLSGKDIEDYKVQSDLYWWYCKQDIFQSMVSGNRLLMPFEHWIYCPPRGQMGKLETTYATMDYLCLIMARLTDFGGKDQLRKRKMVAAQGGQWRPPPNFFGPGNPSPGPPPSKPSASKMAPTNRPASTPAHRTQAHHSSGHTRPPSLSEPMKPTSLPQPTQSQSRGQAPTTSSGPMYGMMPPPTGATQMHSAFHAMSANIHDTGHMHSTSGPLPPPPTTSDDDLSAATALALQEHASINAAFDLFHHLLSNPEYAPLAPDTTPPISTPFGPALQYRTYPISCIWAFYHVGRMLLHRLHPHMPPAAMVSAGVCAHLTHTHAQIVGRICAGLYLPSTYAFQTANLNPSLGSALMESSFSLFFAGIQFQDAAQRGWTVSKLNDVARLTGWQTSSAIAAGCEVCWERMGEMGKGPIYVPTMDRRSKDERLEGRTRRGEGSGEGGVGWGGAVKAETSKRAQMRTTDVDTVEEEEEPDLSINHDRRFINVSANARVHWALGILGVEDDMKKLDMDKP